MTTLTKKELMEKINTLEWQRAGFRETIRKIEAEKAAREEELMAEWTLDSKKAIAYIHELQNENENLQKGMQELEKENADLKLETPYRVIERLKQKIDSRV